LPGRSSGTWSKRAKKNRSFPGHGLPLAIGASLGPPLSFGQRVRGCARKLLALVIDLLS